MTSEESRMKEIDMALPTLTPEQRQAALDKAAQSRRVRAETLKALKAGERHLAEVLNEADKTGPVGKTKVGRVVRSLPGVGPRRAEAILERTGINGTKKTLGGLSERQVSALLAAIAK